MPNFVHSASHSSMLCVVRITVVPNKRDFFITFQKYLRDALNKMNKLQLNIKNLKLVLN